MTLPGKLHRAGVWHPERVAAATPLESPMAEAPAIP